MLDSTNLIYQNILECIGNTPTVRLNKISVEEGISCEIVAKCEYFNAGGSVKDRIAKKMIEAAEADDRLRPGYTIIEPTSGNTGIGLALAGAVKGYKVIITIPEKMSNEKVNLLKALGAQVIRTPTEAASSSPESHISVAKRLNQEISNSIILDQYSNPNNPLAHYQGTAEEIISSCGDHLDMVVIGAGTGGTISGVAKRLKEKFKKLIVIGVDPLGSILSNPSDSNNLNKPYQVEGIGYDFIPEVLDTSLIDSWIITNDSDSFQMARRLIRSEGLLCGGSSGSVTWAAIHAVKAYKFDKDPSKRVLILLPDSVRNYMSKFLDPDWMFIHNFMPIEEFSKEQGFSHFKDFSFKWTPIFTLKSSDSIDKILKFIQTDDNKNIPNFIPVIDENSNQILGNFEIVKLFQLMLREGKTSIMKENIKRFINKDTFVTFSVEFDDHSKISAAFACKTTVYLTDSKGNAVLTDSGCVQTIKLSA